LLVISLARVPRGIVSVCVAALLFSMVSTAHAVTLDMVTVGSPGNAADTTGYGAVGYEYSIGKYEVTISQYSAFLNAVAATDTYGLYNANMGTNANVAGIARSGAPGSYQYAPTGPLGGVQIPQATAGGRPITFVSWFNAARFANWMANGQPSGAQNGTTTENGAYLISGTVSAPVRNTINPNTGLAPTFHIPTEDEWYKAAYYSPTKGGAGSPGYWLYPTQSDTSPGNSIGNTANQVNLGRGSAYSVTGVGYVSSQNYLTDVGSYTASVSYYGTFDQAGNAREWNDFTGTTAGTERGIRGGEWGFFSDFTVSSADNTESRRPRFADSGVGFRLASMVVVPEPSTVALTLAGLTCGGYSMWRRSKRA